MLEGESYTLLFPFLHPVTPISQPPYGDIDDRIRAIANALGLRTIIWTYDSNDWKAVVGTVPPATVDASYQSLIDSANNGTFDTVSVVSRLGYGLAYGDPFVIFFADAVDFLWWV